MLGNLIDAVKGLISIANWKRQLNAAQREKFAKLCDQISSVLRQVSEAPADRRQSINLCAELRQYVEPIKDIAHGTLACDEIDRLATELNRVCDAWKQLSGASELSSDSYDDYLDQLAEGEGQFRGLATRLRTT